MIEEPTDYKKENEMLRIALGDIVMKAMELSSISKTCDEIETIAKEALRRTK